MKLFSTSGLAAVLFALGASANAQVRPNLADDEIVVTGQYLSIDKLNAVKTPTPIIDVPQSLSIVDAIQIKNQAFTSIGDITRYSVGLNISQGEGHRDAIIIRGNQTTADFFQDGVRDDVQYFRPLYNLEQVEILRGANALLFGRGGVGGIINRVTKKPDSSSQFTGVTASIDTFGAHSVAADINRPISETAGFRLNAFYEGLNNHRDFFDGERFAFNPTAAFEVNPDTTVSASYEYVNDDRVVDRGVPSQNVDGGPDIPIIGFDTTFFGSADENNTTLQAHILRGRVDHRFTDTLRGNVTAQFADYDKAYSNLFASEEVNVVNGTFAEVELDGYRDITNRENLFLQGNLVGEFDTGIIGHTVLVGAEYGQQDTENSRLDNVFAANGDDQFFIPFTDPLNVPEFSFSDLSRDRISDVTILSVYFQNQLSFGEKFKLLLGGRYDSFDIDVNDLAENGQFSRKDEEFTPRLGAIYKPAENISVYASYSETFVPRSGDQFLVLNLNQSQTEPQKTENLEAGLKWDVRPGLSFTAAVFEIDRSSVVTNGSDDSDVLDVVDGNTVEGFELQIQGDITNSWSVNAGYSYLNGNVEDLNSDGSIGPSNGNEPRQTPQNMLHIWNNFQITNALGFGLGASYQDSFFVLEDNSVEVPNYLRFDAAAFYDISDDLRIQLNVENLFDINYFPDAHSNDNISTGRPLNARFTISSTF